MFDSINIIIWNYNCIQFQIQIVFENTIKLTMASQKFN